MTKQKPSQRKALRSAAAKKGWETRRKTTPGAYWTQAEIDRAKATGAALAKWLQENTPLCLPGCRCFVCGGSPLKQEPVPPDPNPWPRLSRWIRTLWAKITGTA